MIVSIERNETSEPIEHRNVVNAYTKGKMYCVMCKEEEKRVVYKYPINSLFRAVERNTTGYGLQKKGER